MLIFKDNVYLSSLKTDKLLVFQNYGNESQN
jgi:hypothetical protein